MDGFKITDRFKFNHDISRDQQIYSVPTNFFAIKFHDHFNLALDL